MVFTVFYDVCRVWVCVCVWCLRWFMLFTGVLLARGADVDDHIFVFSLFHSVLWRFSVFYDVLRVCACVHVLRRFTVCYGAVRS